MFVSGVLSSNRKDSEKLTLSNVAESIDNNPLAALDFDDFRCAVRHAAMVDEPCDAALLGCVDDGILVNAEEVTAANAALEVSPLAQFGNLLADLLTDVLDNHVVLVDVFHGVQAPVVDGGPRELDGLLPLLQLVEAESVGILAECLALVVQISDEAAVVDTVGT